MKGASGTMRSIRRSKSLQSRSTRLAGSTRNTPDKLPSWPTTLYMLNALIKGLGGNRLLAEISQRELQATSPSAATGARTPPSTASSTMRGRMARAMKARFDVGEMPDWNALKLKVPKRIRASCGHARKRGLFASLRADVADACDFALKSGWRRGRLSACAGRTATSGAPGCDRIKGGDEIKRPLTPTLLALIANQPKVGPFVFTYVCRKTR
jgi:hypothetical protein